MSYKIPAGVGFHVGVNFARAARQIPLQVSEFRGPLVFGFIPADPASPFVFLRRGEMQESVFVHVNRSLVAEE